MKRYRVIFECASDYGMVSGYRPLWHRGEGLFIYALTKRFEDYEGEELILALANLPEYVGRIGDTYLVGSPFVLSRVFAKEDEEEVRGERYIEVLRQISKGWWDERSGGRFSGMDRLCMGKGKNASEMVWEIGEEVEVNLDVRKTLILQSLAGNGPTAKKLWSLQVIQAEKVVVVVESERDTDELYLLFKGIEFCFFRKRNLRVSSFEVVEVKECEDEIVRFIPLKDLGEVARRYEVRVINPVIVRDGLGPIVWASERVNGVFCAIGRRRERPLEEVPLEVERFCRLKDFDLRVGSVIAVEVKGKKRGLKKAEGLCGVCGHRGEVYVGQNFWGSSTFQASLLNTEYVCEACLKLRELSDVRMRSRFRSFIQVSGRIYSWREVKWEEMRNWRGVVVISRGAGNQVSVYFAGANLILGTPEFLQANFGQERYYVGVWEGDRN